jgi:L-xylulokinase
MPSLVGIDSGLTVTKAVVFDVDGTPLAVARQRIEQEMPAPRHVERDMNGMWKAASSAIRQAIEASGRPASDILAVAATAHGDGIYLTDKAGAPLGRAVLSLDTRAAEIADRWNALEIGPAALALTGQFPHASAPSALLAWIKTHQPERFTAIGHFMASKDWLTYCLTGKVGTDGTEASTSFTDVRTQDYSRAAFELYGLEALFDRAPAALASTAIAGQVTAQAAALTGLVEGTPVAAGLHDVTASALGIGAYRTDTAAIIAGTYSINEVVSTAPKIDGRWFCRNGIAPGEWNNMSISPASTANYDWFTETLCAGEIASQNSKGGSIHDLMFEEYRNTGPSGVLFHPYLFGSPMAGQSTASFLGLNAWHGRGHMVKAVLEGIAYNHRIHVAALRDGFAPGKAKLTGGVSRNPLVGQLFADVMDMPIATSDTAEAAAWGAALCAGVAAGVYDHYPADPRDLEAIETVYMPNPEEVERHNRKFELFLQLAETLAPFWPKLQALEA